MANKKSTKNIITITELRNNIGSISESLPKLGSILLTKDGVPFATLTAVSESKKPLLMKCAGSLKDIDVDDIWKDILKRKSRKRGIDL